MEENNTNNGKTSENVINREDYTNFSMKTAGTITKKDIDRVKELGKLFENYKKSLENQKEENLSSENQLPPTEIQKEEEEEGR